MPSVDRREQILARMKVILDNIPGVVSAWRDRGEIPPKDSETGEVNLPALVLLDGTEDIKVSTAGKNVYGRIPPTLFTLKPQIWLVLMPQAELPNTLGELLSSFRVTIYKAITSDPGLLGLLGTSGGIEYRGSVSDMQSGGSMEGQLRMDFWLDYVLNPEEL